MTRTIFHYSSEISIHALRKESDQIFLDYLLVFG